MTDRPPPEQVPPRAQPNPVMLRRAAKAVRNLIAQDPKRSHWASWVPNHLDAVAGGLDDDTECERPEVVEACLARPLAPGEDEGDIYLGEVHDE